MATSITENQAKPSLAELLPAAIDDTTPGVLIAVMRGSEVLEVAHAGRATLEHPVLISRDTVFAIASTSKHVTAAVVASLHLDGLLDLDGDLRDVLPDLRLEVRISLRQCADHTAGVREYMALCSILGGGTETWYDESRVMRVLSAQRHTDFPAGTDHAYSNSGYILMAAAVRSVTGRSLAQVAQERLFGPLGMTRTRFEDTARLPVVGRAAGYTPYADLFLRATSVDELVGDGGIVTTVDDLARWHGFLSTGAVLGTALHDALLTVVPLADGTTVPYAMGLEHGIIGDQRTVGHGGAIEGFRSHLVTAPDKGLGAVALANRGDVDCQQLATEALAAALDKTVPPRVRQAGDRGTCEGLWWDAESALFLDVQPSPDGSSHPAAIGPLEFMLRWEGGAWSSTTPGSTARLVVRGDEGVFSMGDADLRPRSLTRVPATSAPDSADVAGTYHSLELGALLRVEDDGSVLSVRLGGTPSRALGRGAGDARTWALGTVRFVRGADGAVRAVELSGLRYRHLAFERLPETAVPLGYPVCFGGSVP